MEMAKSKMPGGCGSERLSATIAECGLCWRAILTRFVDLYDFVSVISSNYLNTPLLQHMSQQMISKTENIPVRPDYVHLLVHSKILPIPTAYIRAHCTITLLFQKTLDDRPWLEAVSRSAESQRIREWALPCTAWTRSGMRFLRTRCARARLRIVRRGFRAMSLLLYFVGGGCGELGW